MFIFARCAPTVTTGVFVSAPMMPLVVPAGHLGTTSPFYKTSLPVKKSQNEMSLKLSKFCAPVPSTTITARSDLTAGTWHCDGRIR